MTFNSLNYFLFLPVVYLVFYAVGERARWCVLLAASLLFYAAFRVPYLLAVLALVTLTSYCFGLWLDQASSPRTRRLLLWCGVAVNVAILVLMKYLPFLAENLRALCILLSLESPVQPVQAFVAIGVSYYVFHALSYLFDIYLEIEKPERHFGYFALYLAFFPKLLQGPIERSGDLIPQLKQSYRFNYDNVRLGMLLFAWGLFKKIVLADRLAAYADHVYGNVHAFSGLPLLLATYAYAFQIFLDFSGYTDMALGSALLFNIRLTQNFNSPYLATSVADFWRRWHISFSRWILDYIFKPLQMQWRNAKNWGTAAALVTAFLVSGLWHGASWGFVIWGGLHGLYMACSVFYRPYQKKLHKALGLEKTTALRLWQTFVTFNLVGVTWIFFRSNSLADALYVLSHLFRGIKGTSGLLLSQGSTNLLCALLALFCYALVSIYSARLAAPFRSNTALRWSVYYALVFSIIVFGVKSKAAFIYLGF
jgi:alginate O-acetyltransferase complex protein AlgI